VAEFERIADVGAVPEGQGRQFVVRGRLIALYHKDGEYFAINDTCPHMGASLAEGFLEGDEVYCPWHAWRFCIRDGLWTDNPRANIRTECYPVRVVGTEIQVQLPEPAV
jgi:nitrite reductase (NADH) small subunit/3-phenylpropionate/trans-cinnamate dioxygenase ferredoxin subunit